MRGSCIAKPVNGYNVRYPVSLILIALILWPVKAQVRDAIEINNSQLHFHNIGIEEGFSQNSVKDILQDSRGFMWFATPNGLFKYDGYKFKTFTNEAGNPYSLSHNEIVQIQEDTDGYVWCLSKKSIDRYDPISDRFTRINLEHAGFSVLTGMAVDSKHKGYIWLGTDNNLALLILDDTTSDIKKIIYPVINSPLLTDNEAIRIRSVYQGHNGCLYAMFGSYLVKLNIEDGVPGVIAINKGGFISSLIELSDNQLIVSQPSGISIVEEKESELNYNTTETRIDLPDSFKDKRIHQVLNRPDGGFLLISWSFGMVEMNASCEVVSEYFFNRKDDIFNGGAFGSALIDRNNILWLGTFRGGLYKCDLQRKPFYTIGYRKAKVNGVLTDRFINQICGDSNGNVWIGTYSGGINHLKIVGEQVTYYPGFNTKVGLNNNANCWATCYDQAGNLWICNDDNGIKRIRLNKNGEVRAVELFSTETEPALPFDKVHFFYEDRNGILWIANNARKGLALLKNDNKRPEIIPVNDIRFNNVSVSALHWDNEDYLWVATLSQGIFKLKFDANYKLTELVNLSESIGLKGIPVFSFYEDENGYMWLASFGQGLIKLKKQSESIHEYEMISYRKEQGLPNDGVYAILSTDDKNLWLSTDEGISSFNISNESFVNYNVFDGLQNNNFRKWSAFKNDADYLFFGGTNGFSYFRPDEFSRAHTLPTVQITQLNILQKNVPFLEYQYRSHDRQSKKQKEMELSPNEHSFSIEFASLQFGNPQKTKYRYQLIGADNNWITVDSDQRYASYSHLKHGHYTFRVSASSTDGVFSDDFAQIRIYIRPHWYETWWAFLLYVILFIGFTYAALRFQFKRQELKTQLQVEKMERNNVIELNKAKLNFFTNISHELKTPLTIISGLVDKMLHGNDPSNDKNNLSSIGKNSHRLLQLVNQLLDFRKVEAGHLPARFIKTDIVDFVKGISETFNTYAANHNFNFNFSSEFDRLDVIFDPDKIEKVISNLLSNAMKHINQGGDISLILSSVEHSHSKEIDNLSSTVSLSDYVQISVHDTGKGIPANMLGQVFEQFYQLKTNHNYTNVDKGVGIGLAYSKMLIGLHNGIIYATSEEGKGATFKVIIPLTQKEYETGNEVVEKQLQEAMFNASSKYDESGFIIKDSLQPLSGEIVFHDHEILIVEDNIEIREFLADYLKERFKVLEAEDGLQGLSLAKERIPDIIISDVMMPKMDGYEMCRSLKEDEKTNHIPIILLTANGQTEQRIEGLKAGADSYIPKPFHLEHLMTRIHKLLELRNKLKQKYLSLSGTISLEDIDVNAEDKIFLQNIDAIIEDNLSNSELSVKDIEVELGYSRMQLYRKLKTITDLSAVEYIRNYRLKRAVEMMHSSQLRVTEIVFTVGFTSASYFGKCFRQKYGKTPTDFLNDARSL